MTLTARPPAAMPAPRASARRAIAALFATAAIAGGLLSGCGGGSSTLPPVPTPAPPPGTIDVSPVDAHDPGSTLDAGWSHGAVMEIFVRSYQDSDGDGIGDLKGLASRLDYLRDLGVRAVWLMPVTASMDHDHGYAVEDYRGVEAAYGSLADLDDFVAQAHARGIGVVLDYVMNHSASRHPVFLASAASTTSPYRDWYLWQAGDPGTWSIYGQDPWHAASTGWYFGGFWSGMPDWNLRNEAVVGFHEDNLRFWLNRGVDGFRFDAVANLVENGPSAWEAQPEDDALMTRVREEVLSAYANRWMVCEAPPAPQRFGAPGVCGSAFAFDLRPSIVAAAQGDAGARSAVLAYFQSAPPGMSVMVSNHDSFAGQRLWNQVGGDLPTYRLAAATYLLLPGTPFIYYGEEVGMSTSSVLSGDPTLRTPMSWTGDSATGGFTTGSPYRALADNVATNNVSVQVSDPQSLLAFYKALLALRNGRPSLSSGAYVAPFGTSAGVMGFQRTLGAETTLVALNTGATAASPSVGSLPPHATLQALYPAGGGSVAVDGGGVAVLPLAAKAVTVWAVVP